MSAVAPLTFQPGEIVLNKYEIIRPLGSGQFGDVFHVVNRNLGRESALKLTQPGARGDQAVMPMPTRYQRLNRGHRFEAEVLTPDEVRDTEREWRPTRSVHCPHCRRTDIRKGW